MPDISDYELRKTPDEPSAAPVTTRATGVWIAAALLVIAAAVAAYIAFRGPGASTPATSVAPTQSVPLPPPARPLGGTAEAIDVPPLDQSDALVRELVKKLTSQPSVLAWLATDGLIRNFTVSVANIADGKTPAAHLRVLRPALPFAVVEGQTGNRIDPRSYERYNGLAAAAASIDPAGAAQLYATLKPRIEEAYGELGVSQASFDRALERAIVLLLQTPVVAGDTRVVPKGIGYQFADPALESLTPAQKQLLRTGPNNVRSIQSSLRAIAQALGIPAQRLP